LFQEGKENNAMDTNIKRINPLLVIAAASLVVFSAVGIAALTGKAAKSELELPADVARPLAPAISHPVTKPAASRPAVRSTAPFGQLAVIESVREVKEPGQAKGVGAVAGGVAGGVLGHKLGKGKGLVTVIGAAAGAFGGHQIEKQVRAEKHWETTIRLDDGTQRTFDSEAQPSWRVGERVRLVNGELRAA
jgi:outer membrane lipoprotein SlyB